VADIAMHTKSLPTGAQHPRGRSVRMRPGSLLSALIARRMVH
jgi:hypothetical protein